MRNNSKTVWFTSDLHFGHTKVIEYSNRPFKTVEEMDSKLIQNWNSVVKPSDTVIVVGDFFMYHKKERLKEILTILNGSKVLVKGNHDMSAPQMLNIGFDHVCENMTIRIANQLVNVSHYPYKPHRIVTFMYTLLHKIFPKRFYKPRKFVDQLEDDGKFLIHGHTHSRTTINGRMIHVGVDARGYKPVSLQQIGNEISILKKGKK